MVNCPACQTAHIANTLFCAECGHYLERDNTDDTLIGYIPARRPKSGKVAIGPLLSPDTSLHALRLHLGPNRRQVEIPLKRAIYLGRLAPASNAFPEIDLTDQGLLAQSVSRRHARISKRDNLVFVEDLDSGNGTFVNGERLSPYLPEPLSDGDILQLGQVPIEVRFLTGQL